MDHLSDEHIEGYARRTLGPADLLAVDDHLAACAPCRDRAAALAGTAHALASLLADLRTPDAHLSEADVAEHVAGRTAGDAAAALDAHLRACATCAREVADLRRWADGRVPSRRLRYAAAAAVLLAAALIPALVHRSRVPEVGSPSPAAGLESLAGYASLPAAAQQRVRSAIQAGAASVPADVAALAGPTERLMGISPPPSFRLTSPLATAVVSDRPTLRWEPIEGAREYAVTITDEALRPVAQSPALHETSWAPAAPLARGRVYLWQVTARRDADTLTAPAPPAPLAKMKILDGDAARLIEETARAHPDAHLVLGILAAEAGVRGEAESHLQQVPPTDRYQAVARKTLERVRRSDLELR